MYVIYPQIEGIIGSDYINKYDKKPDFSQLIKYIKQKAEIKYNVASPISFQNEFYKYLNETIFEDFDIKTGKVNLSRHTATHGYANAEDFNKAKALQAILILDQIYYYL